MKKIVNIINIINNRKFQASFIDDESGMNEWIAKLEAKALRGIGWGYGPRSMSKAECIAKGLEVLIINEYLKEIDGDLTEQWVDLKAEYEITIEDVTTEYEAELQEKANRKNDIDDLKATAIDRIDSWNTASDLVADFNIFKRMLKRFVKEL